eukprot:Gb_19258 [translate_table: standard]
MGRRKIPTEKREKKSERQVTFSKRKAGVLKKASELSIMCGVDVGFIVFSPAGSPFSFGHPSVDHLIHKLLRLDPLPPPPAPENLQTHLTQHASLQERYQRENVLNKALKLRDNSQPARGQFWWEDDTKNLNPAELKAKYHALKLFKSKLELRIAKLRANDGIARPATTDETAGVNNQESDRDRGIEMEAPLLLFETQSKSNEGEGAATTYDQSCVKQQTTSEPPLVNMTSSCTSAADFIQYQLLHTPPVEHHNFFQPAMNTDISDQYSSPPGPSSSSWNRTEYGYVGQIPGPAQPQPAFPPALLPPPPSPLPLLPPPPHIPLPPPPSPPTFANNQN